LVKVTFAPTLTVRVAGEKANDLIATFAAAAAGVAAGVEDVEAGVVGVAYGLDVFLLLDPHPARTTAAVARSGRVQRIGVMR